MSLPMLSMPCAYTSRQLPIHLLFHHPLLLMHQCHLWVVRLKAGKSTRVFQAHANAWELLNQPSLLPASHLPLILSHWPPLHPGLLPYSSSRIVLLVALYTAITTWLLPLTRCAMEIHLYTPLTQTRMPSDCISNLPLAWNPLSGNGILWQQCEDKEGMAAWSMIILIDYRTLLIPLYTPLYSSSNRESPFILRTGPTTTVPVTQYTPKVCRLSSK
jgi:hypothetical protein